ncbi:Swt1 family HEPN domain-containing protein [Amycolatopsis sp. NPDC059657]|uniref:Swt1 family HEPN domain-containing protein n=1 Tax=Amycolatopsis sp. NPDC059657 TaxID=3346899 RepID=UPI00366EFF07
MRSWLFKGLAVEHALNELERDGTAVRAETDPQALQRVMPMEDFSAPLRRSGMRALPSYLAFFMLENSARELIFDRLLEAHGPDWWDRCASQNLKRNVASRQEKEGKNRWHMQRGASEIYYTDFGDLSSLIQNNWGDFNDLFPDVDWVLARFRELEASRNIVAHNNLLDERELDRLKMYLSDWVKQVG